MAEAFVAPNVALSQLHPGRPEIESALRDIDTASQGWFGKAESASLGDYCHRAIDGLTVFLGNLGDLKVFRAGDGPKNLQKALRKVARYLHKKADPRHFVQQVIKHVTGDESITSTEKSLWDEVTEAVRLHVEVVVEAAKRLMDDANRQGRAILVARRRRIALQVWYEVKALNGCTEFGYTFMKGYEIGLGESKTINDVWQSLQESMDLQRIMVGKIEGIRRELDAGRVLQEEAFCPKVFFLVPADTSRWSALDHLERWRIFTENMNLVFMCHTFFEEVHATMQQGPGDHPGLTAANKFQDECSEFIDIAQPRDFFVKHRQAIKFSALVIQVIGLAAAFFGVSVPGLLPSDLSELDDLTKIMETGLDAAVAAATSEEDEPILEEQSHSSRRRPWWKFKWGCGTEIEAVQHGTSSTAVQQRLRDGCAHHVLQHYLTHNEVEWRSKVHRNLKLAHNEDHGYTYVCKRNPQHETIWQQRRIGFGSGVVPRFS
ncbi:unnamed protein product [Ectocarpus sp. CCAP 1310/34]|nr:unnamed protein product [Ectocarpus sp. CCAP 1310/34]